jgi:HrpA-like RNA helicase
MGTERKRKVSLFDVVDETSVSAKLRAATNGAAAGAATPAVNRWNGRPFSARYHEILEKRRTLPVWQQKDEFLRVLRDSQTLILVGETGSGKTTQVRYSVLQYPYAFAYTLIRLYGYYNRRWLLRLENRFAMLSPPFTILNWSDFFAYLLR